MKFLPLYNRESLSESTSVHILIALLKQEAMSTSDDSQDSQRSHHHRARDGSDDSQLQHNTPRRRSIAIQDILNPAGGDRSNSPRYSSSPSFHEAGERPGSNSTSPKQYSRRTSVSPTAQSRRRVSMSSKSSGARDRRQFRPTYQDEEVYFIWYYRIDLGYDWQDIANAYNAQFPDRPRDGFGGIQCKYYRYCEEFGIPKVRNRDRSASAVKEYGMRSRTGRTYSWMKR